MLQQLVQNGKWHVRVPTGPKTACGQRIPMSAPLLRDVDLVDSEDRCRDPRCLSARSTR